MDRNINTREISDSSMANAGNSIQASVDRSVYQSPGFRTSNSDESPKAVELKFLVDLPLARQIIGRASEELLLDPFSDSNSGTYGVSSYYLDTVDLDIFYRTELLNGTKYRFRKYDGCNDLFLERKVRRQGIVSKTRYLADLDQLKRCGALELPVWGEVVEFELKPCMAVHYTRHAFVQPNSQSPFRVTVDTQLFRHSFLNPINTSSETESSIWGELANYAHDFAASSKTDSKYSLVRHQMLPTQAVLEFKFMEHMPKHLISWLEDFKIAPVKFSKYRHDVSEFQKSQGK